MHLSFNPQSPSAIKSLGFPTHFGLPPSPGRFIQLEFPADALRHPMADQGLIGNRLHRRDLALGKDLSRVEFNGDVLETPGPLSMVTIFDGTGQAFDPVKRSEALGKSTRCPQGVFWALLFFVRAYTNQYPSSRVLYFPSIAFPYL